jgi:hypothetical protein
MQIFRDVLTDCGLSDFGYVGDKFTWHRAGIRERLDRGLINEAWLNKFEGAVLQNLDYSRSDHRPIMISFGENPTEERCGPNFLRFEARWLKEPNFYEVVEGAWDASGNPFQPRDLAGRLAVVHKRLHQWDRSVLKGPKRKLKAARKELEEITRSDLTAENIAKEKDLAMEIEKLLEQEELHWSQRSRINWLQFGDRNTGFFHRFASARRQRNRIKRLKDEQDEWQEEIAYLNPMISGYFAGLFSTEVEEPDPNLLDMVVPRVSENMNEALMQPFSADDVKHALFSIGDMKAPGLDGLHALFFKKCWSIIGESLTQEVLLAINNKVIPEGWNDTVIVLIPKVETPERITQYRPISLCNVLYKVISKMIAARLKVILDEVISQVQSAFVPGRLITDNILLAYESMNTIKNKRTGKEGYCAVKLDMHKAYDRVEWVFLERMLSRLGFHADFIDLLMACVSSVKYKVRYNDQDTDVFIPTRGLRQGDPLSPYLFLICAEGLSSALAQKEEVLGIEGVRVCRNAPSVSHLLFADDSLILMKANMTNATSLRQVLEQYCASSGQMVSEAKCSIFFSPNVQTEMKAQICGELNIMTEAISEKYLGLPAMVGLDRTESFVNLLERIIERLKSWKERLLSLGGKEIFFESNYTIYSCLCNGCF